MKYLFITLSFLLLTHTALSVTQRRKTTLLQQFKVVDPDADSVNSYVHGVLSGFGVNSYFSAIQPCLNQEGVFDELSNAQHQLNTDTIASILIALQEIGAATQIIPDAAAKCNVQIPNLAAIQDGVDQFKNPGSFDYIPGQSLWLNGFEIYHQIYRGRELLARERKNSWTSFGRHVARAIVRLVLGDNAPIENDMTNFVNEVGNFEAALPTQFQGKSLRQLAGSLVGTIEEIDELDFHPEFRAEDPEEVLLETSQIPANFDSRTQWPGCIRGIPDQGYCGSCWAFSVIDSIGDRLCINSSGHMNVSLSVQTLVSCDTAEFGCNGGYLSKTWKYVESSGVFTQGCSPYLSYQGVEPSGYTCGLGTVCSDVSTPKLYYARVGTTTKYTSATTIQNNILKWGPMTCTMNVYEDFFAYSSGIYSYTTGALAGGHAVRIIGWGVDDTTAVKYWIVANSWGTWWGEGGFFKLKFGQVNIEKNCYAAQPDVARSGL